MLFALAGRGDPNLFRAVLRVAPGATLGPLLLVVAGPLAGGAKLAVWAAALSVSYLGPIFAGMRGWRISPAHFVGRYGLVVIIALGETVVAIGLGAAGLPLDAGVLGAAVLGIVVAACLWWAYFDWVIYVAQAHLAEATGAARAALARDAYAYLHLPMVAGVVLLAHVGLRLRLGAGLGRGRPVASVPSAVEQVGDRERRSRPYVRRARVW